MSIQPTFIGQTYQDNPTGNIWEANSLALGDWTLKVQDPKVRWIPRNINIFSMIGFFTYGDLPGVTQVTFLGSSTLAGFDFEYTASITDIEFPNLASIDPLNTQSGYVACIGNSGLVTVNLPLLASAPGYFLCRNNTALTTLNTPAFVTIGGECSCDGNTSLGTLSFPSLQSVGGDFNCYGSTLLATCNFPNLETVGGAFYCYSNPALTTVDLSSLTAVANAFEFYNNTSLTTLDLSSLTSEGGDFKCYGNTSLVSLNLHSAVTFAYNCYCYGNTSLTTVDLASWIPTDGSTIRFDGCALNAASVQLILRRCVLAGVTTCTINLSGGTNAGVASLNAQGQTDAATLGAQLTINP